MGYTEFVELRVATPIYVVMVEFGSPRGMGAIVGVKAKNPAGEWMELYQGKPQLNDYLAHKSTNTYWKWAPNTCRTHFKTTDFRIELDTSTETGIEDWNYLDYMKVYGTDTLQPAALPYGQSSIVYLPHANAFGADQFTFAASDCTGNIFRSGLPATVSFTIAAVNDAPTTTDQDLWTDIDAPLNISLLSGDVDAADTLTYTISKPPGMATLTLPSGASIPAEGWTSATPPVVVATSSTEGEEDFEFSVSDGTVATTGKVKLQYVKVPADFVPRDDAGAYAVYAMIGLCATLKVFLLGYLLKHKAHPVFRDAQPVFCIITILGGVMGDLTPLFLFGAISDTRCHGFASYLLVATTLLYGPLVLKSYRIWRIFDNPTMKNVNLGSLVCVWVCALKTPKT